MISSDMGSAFSFLHMDFVSMFTFQIVEMLSTLFLFIFHIKSVLLE